MADGKRVKWAIARSVALLMAGAVLLNGCAGTPDRGGAPGGLGDMAGDEDALQMALAQMAQASEQRHRYAKAVEQYGRLVEAEPDEPAYVLGLARNTRYAGRPDESVRILRRAIAQDRLDETLDVRLEMARALLASGVNADAAAMVADLRQRAPADPRVQALAGILADREGRHVEAQAAYRAAMAADPDDLRSANNLALSLALTGDLREAIRVQTEVARRPEATLTMRQNLALLYALAGRMDMAEQVTRAILPKEQADRVLAELARMKGQGRAIEPSL
jgi:Flp pilus assembly protein TadD